MLILDLKPLNLSEYHHKRCQTVSSRQYATTRAENLEFAKTREY